MNNKRISVGLLWHSLASGNLGVGALTESNILIVSSLADKLGIKVRFVVLGNDVAQWDALKNNLAERGHLLESYRVRVFRRSYRDLIDSCDCVLDIGEGDSFADIYGLKRFFFLWLSKNLVVSRGKPLVLSPQTIGPFDSWISRVLATQVMRRCHTVFARDDLSTSCLKQLKIIDNADEAIDVAFRLPFKKYDQLDKSKIHIGVNVSGLLFNGGYTGSNELGLTIDYAATIRNLLYHFSSMQEVQIHIVSHVIEPNMPVEDDMAVAQALALEFPNVIVAPEFQLPSEAKSYISGMDYFFGARMHACIAAFSSGVAVVPMAYSRKFNGLFGTLGYKYMADCKKDNQNEVVNKVIDGFQQRELLKLNVESGLQLVNTKMSRYESVLYGLLDSLRKV